MVFEYPGDGAFGSKRLIVYEQRLWSPYWGKEDCEDGCTFYGDEGYLMVDMHQGWKLYGPKNQRKEAKRFFDIGEHCADFLDAIRNGRMRPSRRHRDRALVGRAAPPDEHPGPHRGRADP